MNVRKNKRRGKKDKASKKRGNQDLENDHGKERDQE
jgi:hypothetical protein